MLTGERLVAATIELAIVIAGSVYLLDRRITSNHERAMAEAGYEQVSVETKDVMGRPGFVVLWQKAER